MNSTTIESAKIEIMAVDPVLRIVGATSYAILSLISVIMNALLTIVLVQGHRAYKKFAFYIIIWQHIVVDQLTMLIQFIVAVPITYAGTPIYGESSLLHGFTLFDTIAYNGTLYFTFLMTLNRFTVFIWPWLNKKLFEHPGIYVTIGSVWSWILCFVATINLTGCAKGFASDGFYYYNFCDNGTFGQSFSRIQGYASNYLPIVMVFVYFIIYLYVKFLCRMLKVTPMNNDHKEYKILIQSFLICGFLILQNLAFRFIPYLKIKGQWSYVLNFIQNNISIVNNTINPIVLFIFNSEIRLSLKNILKKNQVGDIGKITSAPRMSINVSVSSNMRRLS